MTQLEKILSKTNDTSLAKICFYNKPFDDLLHDLDFYNIIFAGDGLYIGSKNDFAASIDKIESIKYTNSGLNNFDNASGIYPFIPKPTISVFVKIIEMFKYVYTKMKAEVCVNVYYDKKSRKFIISIEEQLVNGTNADYDYTEKFEMSKNYIRYLQIHSHHTMGAGFSPKDDNDEKLTALCYYGVVGKLNSDSSFYNVDTKFRIWNGIRFADISLSDVFDIGVSKFELTTIDFNKLDSIIEKSQEVIANKNLAATPFPNFQKVLEGAWHESSDLM